jgi:hypothetical protein
MCFYSKRGVLISGGGCAYIQRGVPVSLPFFYSWKISFYESLFYSNVFISLLVIHNSCYMSSSVLYKCSKKKIKQIKLTFYLLHILFVVRFIIIIIIINSYSLWHRLETTHAKDTICFTKRKILKKKKNSSTLIQSSSRLLNDFASFKSRVNDVFNLFIRCYFQYQELKIVCVTDQTSEMSNF